MRKTTVRKKICMVTQSHYASDPRVRREAETIVAGGMKVYVLGLRQRGESRRTHLNGVDIYGLSLTKRRAGVLRYSFEYLTFLVWASWMLLALQLQHGFAVIQVHTLPDFLVFSAIIPRWLGAKVILDMHEIMPEFFASKFKVSGDHVFIKLLALVERWSIRFAHAVITVNDPIKELLISRGVPAEKITVVMNSVDETAFDAIRAGQVPQKNGAEFRLMYHGTLTDIYGLDVAIRALDIIRRHIPQVSFHIFGDGPEAPALRHLAARLQLGEQIVFHGRVPLDHIPGYLTNCDVGVLPTRQDEFLDLSFSNKLLEYVYMGKPVVCSGLRTTQEYFQESSLAYFRPHDHEELAHCVVTLWQQPERRSALVRSALQDYQQIKWDIMRQRYLSLIDNVTAQRR